MRQNKSRKNDMQGNTKFSYNDKTRNNMVTLRNINRKGIFLQILYFRYGMSTSTRMQLSVWILQMQAPSRSSKYRGKDYFNAGDTYF